MRDDAVSPVIGVMLMLSITVIIAAVLTTFAGGFADTNLASPSVDISAGFVGSGDDRTLRLSHDGGEPLNPADIRVTAYVTTANASGTAIRINEIFSGSTWNAGELITVPDTPKLLGLTKDEMKAAAKLSTPVEIRIYHIPSSEIIAQATILLEGA